MADGCAAVANLVAAYRARASLQDGAARLGAALQSDAVTGLGRLAPEGVREVKDLEALERASGVERGVNVIVSADDLTAPGAIPWMVAYQRRVLPRHGYTEKRPCPRAELCPAVALTDLFGSARERTRAQTRRLLNELPRYFTQGVISRDRRTANISFSSGACRSTGRRR